MFDVALSNAGAQVVLTTSSDQNYPPENMLDGNVETFWTSTGMFPQEFILSFKALIDMNSIKIHCYQVKGLCIERSVKPDPDDFEVLDERELSPSDASLQLEEFPFQATTAHHLRFTIKSGFDHFVSVHRIHVDGRAVNE